jgi:2,4-dienoyl-CoA reductase-like NADH-dependent reductase (Old Yellow Enzyme family)
MEFPHLFSPLRIGPLEARNRIVFGAHFTMFSEPARSWGEPGFYGARLGRYLGERARGGAGVVIAGQAAVHATTAYQMPNNACAWDEAAIPHFAEVTRPVHEHGALAFLQLAHNGGVNGGAWSKRPAWAPSHVANYHEPPKQIEPHEIAEVIAGFAASAHNAVAGGFDGIEIHAAHGYLIHEFLSPRSNQRTDEWGGSLENRMRFAIAVLRAVRDAVGPAKAVGVRLVGDEEAGASGLGANDAAQIAAKLETAGLADFVNVSVGISGVGMVRPLYAKPGFGVYAAAAVTRARRATPVFAVHRILTPAQAESIVANGDADAVTLVRALIADPEWPAKAQGGRASEIRRCTGNNQGCYGNLLQGLPVSCVQNPAVGRENELGFGTLGRATRSKRVVVVGGGPAGLEAAWVAAARGHDVQLFERDVRFGGKVHWAALLPGRGELLDHAHWRLEECKRRGVHFHLGTNATRESVLALAPDAVIVATGGRADKRGHAKWHPIPIAGLERDFVIDHEEALRRSGELRGRIVILDAVGHIEGIGIGELLVTKGCEVTLAMPLATPMGLDAETMAAALPRAVRAGVRWRPTHGLVAVGDHEVTLLDLLAVRPERIEAVDWVVIRTHGVPDDALYFALQGAVPEVIRVGDAVAMRLLDRAIFDGHLAGRAI